VEIFQRKSYLIHLTNQLQGVGCSFKIRQLLSYPVSFKPQIHSRFTEARTEAVISLPFDLME
jgi:hypothetical protein